MYKIPFEKQVFPANPVADIEYKIAQGEPVSGDELLDAIEHYPLNDRVTKIVRRFSVAAVKRRGRPSKSKGREDFALEEVHARYPALLRKHEEEAQERKRLAAAKGEVLATAEKTPSELAYTELLQDMKAVFPNLDWLALRNKHSAWKNGHFHSTENDNTGTEDIDAEIDRICLLLQEDAHNN